MIAQVTANMFRSFHACLLQRTNSVWQLALGKRMDMVPKKTGQRYFCSLSFTCDLGQVEEKAE